MSGPLNGIRVIDASTILAGPLCCQILGDFGADVIKVEHPSRPDGMRGHGPSKNGTPLWWKEISRNKRAMTVDLSHADGREVMLRLLQDADVLVENFRPGTLERWGLAPDELLAQSPRLIVARVTGFGQKGPYASRPGFGTLVEAMSGFAHLTGPSDGPPTLPAFGLADSLCGMTAAAAVSMALLHRTESGRGQVLDLDLLSPLLTAVGPGPMVYQQLGTVESRHGNRSTNNAPRNTYLTRDGQWVAISSSADSIARRVMAIIGRPEIADEDWFATGRGRAEHADLIDEHVANWIGARDRDDVIEQFTVAGAAVAPVYSAEDIVEDPHIREAELLTAVDDDELGPLLMHNVLWRMSGTPGSIRFNGRDHGADTDQILVELGYDDESVARLRSAGVI